MIPALILFVLIPLLGTAAVALIGFAWSFLRQRHDQQEALRLATRERMLDHWAQQALDGRTLMMDRHDLAR